MISQSRSGRCKFMPNLNSAWKRNDVKANNDVVTNLNSAWKRENINRRASSIPRFQRTAAFCDRLRRKRSTHSTNREDQPPDGVCETGGEKTSSLIGRGFSQVMFDLKWHGSLEFIYVIAYCLYVKRNTHMERKKNVNNSAVKIKPFYQ